MFQLIPFHFKIFKTKDLEFTMQSNKSLCSLSQDSYLIIQQAFQYHNTFKRLNLNEQQSQLLMSEILNTLQSKYKIIAKLGQGSYAVTFIVINYQDQSEEYFVLKIICKQFYKNDQQLKSILQEISIMQTMKYQCILSARKVLESQNFFFIEMDLMDIDLHQFIKTNDLDKNIKFSIIVQLCLGLRYLHQLKIVHRDIKLDNILVCNKYCMPVIKISDFGISTFLNQTGKCSGTAGTSIYMAPELFLQKEYNEKCDIWSLGILVYQLLLDTLPYKLSQYMLITDLRNQFKNVQTFIANIEDNDTREVLSHMLVISPQLRYSADQLLHLQCLKPYIQFTRELFEEAECQEMIYECDDILKQH